MTPSQIENLQEFARGRQLPFILLLILIVLLGGAGVTWYKNMLSERRVFTVLFGGAGVSLSADYQKGLNAATRGDFATALREWKPLAEQRNAVAQKDLSVMYAFGKGVPKDYVYAHMWGNLAAANGDGLGGMLRDDYERKMTPSDISAAKKLARECVHKNYKGC